MSLTAQYIVSPDAVQSFLSHSAVFSHRSIAFSSAVFTATATRNRVYHVITAVAICILLLYNHTALLSSVSTVPDHSCLTVMHILRITVSCQ